MKKILLHFILVSLFSSCLIQGTENKRRVNSFNINNPDNGNDPTPAPDFSLIGNAAWFGTELKGVNITVNGDTDSSISLRGKQIHNFLKNNNPDFDRSYCIVFHRFNDVKAAKQLRLRAIANSIIDFENQTRELAFRVELQDEAGAKEICGGTLLDRGPEGNPGTVSYSSAATSNANVAFSLSKLCFNNNCVSTDLFTSTSVTIYESIQNSLNDTDIIIQSIIGTSILALKVGYSTSINNNASFCTADNTCTAQAFDCCNDNQCVNDGTIRPNAQSDFPTDYTQAQLDVGVIPERYKSWPNIYNICENP
jgi:hypothetical protein